MSDTAIGPPSGPPEAAGAGVTVGPSEGTGLSLLHALRPVGRRRLADDIVEQIRRLIVEEELEAGARLPSERDLAERCRSSRAVVAQALRTLSLMGLVEIRAGSGAYVLRNPATMVRASVDLVLELRQGSMDHLCQLRLWLETLGAIEGAAAADEAHLRQLEAAFDRLAACDANASSLMAADANFHALLVAGAGNPYLTALYENVHTAVVTVEHERWVRTDDAPGWLGSSHAEEHVRLHRPILDAVRARDEQATRAALLAHHAALLEHLVTVRGDPGAGVAAAAPDRVSGARPPASRPRAAGRPPATP